MKYGVVRKFCPKSSLHVFSKTDRLQLCQLVQTRTYVTAKAIFEGSITVILDNE